MKRLLHSLKSVCVLLSLMFFFNTVVKAQTIISANTNWSAIAPTPTAATTIEVRNGATLTVNVTNAVCASIQIGATASPGNFGVLTFSGTNPHLTVSGAINVGGFGNAARTGTINFTSTATLTGASMVIGSTSGTPGENNLVSMTAGGTLNLSGNLSFTAHPDFNTITQGTGSVITVGGTATINQPSADNINNIWNVNSGTATVTGLITLAGGTNSTIRDGRLVITTGTLNADGGISITSSNTASKIIDMTGASGTLNVGGTGITGSANGTFTAGTGTSKVNYNETAAQANVGGYTYNYLTLSGSGAKTISGVTVNGIFSMEETATASAAPTYGAAATLRYNTATPRNAGVEWITPFAATGGINIANTGAITMNAAKVLNSSVPLTINSGSTLITNNLQLNMGGNFDNNGTFTAGSSTIIIGAGTATQSIDGFTTTGPVSMTKTGGTATLQGAVTAASLTIGTAGGTLNLGAALTHQVNGAVTISNGTLNGGSSTLNVTGNWTKSGGTFTGSTGTVAFINNAAQLLNGSSATTFFNLTINKTAAANTVTSQTTAFTSTGTVAVTQGNLVLTAANANYTVNDITVSANGKLSHNVDWGTGFLLGVGGNMAIDGVYEYVTGAGSPRAHVQMTGAGKTVRTGTTALSIFTILGGTITANGTVSANDNFWAPIGSGSFTTGANTINANAALLISGGTTTVNGGTVNVIGGISLGTNSVAGILTFTSGNIITDGIIIGDGTATTTGTGTITQSSGSTMTVNGAVLINQQQNTATNVWNLNAGTATVSGTITFAGSSATASRIGRMAITTGTLNANGGITFVTSAVGNKVIDMSGGAGTINLKGALTVPATSSTLTAGTSGSIFNYNDNTTAQTVNFFSSGGYHNLHINTTGGVGATLNAAISATNVTGNLRVQTGTLNNGGFAIVGNAARTFQVANAAFFNLGGTTSAFPTAFGTVTLGATSTVNYAGSGAQTISAQNYGHLTTTLNGTRTITLANSGTIGIAGVFTPAGGTTSYTNTGSTVSFNGTSGSQNVPAFAFNNLTINNTSGVALTGNVSVNGTTNALTFTNGKITTGANTITLASGVTVTTAGAGKYVFGNQAWVIPTGTPTRTFYIGDASNYTPAVLAFTTTITTGGAITASTTTGDHPQIGTSGLDASKSVNRFWTLTNTTVAPVGYTATFNFIGPTPGSGDIDAGVTTSNLIIKRYDGSWSPTTAGAAAATSTQATAINAFGDFQIAEQVPCVAPTIDAPVVTNVSCNGGNDGSITISTTGGTPPFTYLWSPNGEITQNISGLVAGTYSVTITASGGCTVSSGTITVTEPDVLNANNIGTDASCGINDGAINITSPTGGSGTYEYTIDGGANWELSGSFTGLAPANYDVRIRDAAHPACVVILDAAQVIAQASAPDAPASGGNQTVCSNGDDEQTITATATSPATIVWYDAATAGNVVAPPSLTGVGTVTYYAEATSGACVSSTRTAVTLTIQEAPLAPISGGDQIVCSNGDPMQTLIATATSPATITWFDAATGGSIVSPPALIGVGTVTYYAEASNGTCISPERTPVTLSINPVLATPGTITGPLDVCPLVGSPTPSVYSIDPVAGATFYTWVVPVGTTIITGQGTTSIEVTFDNSFALTNSMFIVTAESPSACTSGPSSIEVLKVVPGIPTVINGPTDACTYIGQPTTAVYTIDPVANATSYTWQVSNANMNIESGQGTLSIEVSYLAGFTSGNIKVTANSNCGNRAPRSLNIAKFAPAVPTAINGPADACPFIGTATEVNYTIDPVANATSYTWTVPANVTLVSGQGSTSIMVTFNSGYTTSLIKVKSVSNCGNSGDRSLSVVAAVTSIPGNISGPTNACIYIGTPNNATYSIAPVVNATSYTWTVPTGATIESGQGTTSIDVSFDNSFVSGTNISVQAIACIASAARTLSVQRIVPSIPGVMTGSTNVCPFMVSVTNPSGTPVPYSIRKVANATSYLWTAPSGATITAHPAGAGVNDTTIEITYSAGFVSGSVTVAASSDCGTSGLRSLSVTRLMPSTPGAITTVNTAPCPNRQYTYSLAAMPANTTSILWTVPAAGTILSGQGTTSITVSYTSGAVTGTVTATAYNNCSNSGTRSININLTACGPRPAGRIAATTTVAPTVEGITVNVYPNPTVSDFKLQVVTAGNEKISVRILDLQGRGLKSFTVMPYQTINIGADLKAGSYMVEVSQGRNRTVQKLVKF